MSIPHFYEKQALLLTEVRKHLVGVRDPTKRIVVAGRDRRDTNSMNDLLGHVYPGRDFTNLVDNRALMPFGGQFYAGTADPGKLPRFHKGNIATNPKGVGRYAPGYYPEVFVFGRHSEKEAHPCLRQVGSAFVERFDHRNGEWLLQAEAVDTSYNMHRASVAREETENVNDWSHGCLVFANWREHWAFLLAMGYPAEAAMFEALATTAATGHQIVTPPAGAFDLLVIDMTNTYIKAGY